jgi:hypothetical protein
MPRVNGREVEIDERNGNLVYVTDRETGAGQWVCPFEIED